MRSLKCLAVAGLILAVSGTTGAVAVPLPPNGDMAAKAYGTFAEVFLVVTDGANPFGLPVGTYNNIGIGVFDKDAGTAGVQPSFVLYTGANSTTTSAATGPTTIIAVDGVMGVSISDVFSGKGAFGGKTRGQLYVGGVINTISTQNGSVTYNHGPADSNPNPQLTFALYNAKINNLTLNTGAGDQLITNYIIDPSSPANNLHFDVWADATPDASLGATAGTGERYQSAATANSNCTPELPVRDNNAPGFRGTLMVNLADGTYYDRSASKHWGELAFAGDPTDDDQVMWSFVGNPMSFFEVTQGFGLNPGTSESFTAPADLNGDGDANDTVNGVSEAAVSVYISGSSKVTPPPILQLQGQLIPGQSLAPAGKTYGGFGSCNNLLHGDYTLSANLVFGGQNTGAYDSDPGTFSYQQGFPGGVGPLTQLTIRAVPIPGDANSDGIVDATDYALWFNNYGASGPGFPGDMNSDYTVDMADYALWFNYYGVGWVDSVPEPATLLLMAMGGLAVIRRRRT